MTKRVLMCLLIVVVIHMIMTVSRILMKLEQILTVWVRGGALGEFTGARIYAGFKA